MIFDEIIERAVIGAQRVSKLPPERLRVIVEASFPQINSQVSEAFAAREDKRSLLRKDIALVFVGGSIGIPSNVLKKYLKDATLVLATGDTASLIEPYADFLRVRDTRLAWWAYSNLLISARANADNGGAVYAGNATLTCLASPDVPAAAATTYAGSDDMLPELIDALTEYASSGKTENEAAEAT